MYSVNRGIGWLGVMLLVVVGAASRAADQTCAEPAPTPPASGVCSVTAGDANKLLRGTVLLPDGVASNGSVLLDTTGAIACAGCGCQSLPEGHTHRLCARGDLAGPDQRRAAHHRGTEPSRQRQR